MEQPNGHPCPECGTPRQPDNTPSCTCTHRAAEALRNARTTEAAAAEDFDPLRIRPYVELTPETVTEPPEAESTPRGRSMEGSPPPSSRTDAATRAPEGALRLRADGPPTPAESSHTEIPARAAEDTPRRAPGRTAADTPRPPQAHPTEPRHADDPTQPSPANHSGAHAHAQTSPPDAPARAAEDAPQRTRADVPTTLWHAKGSGPEHRTRATVADSPLSPTGPARAAEGALRGTSGQTADDAPRPPQAHPTAPRHADDPAQPSPANHSPSPRHGQASPADAPGRAAEGAPRPTRADGPSAPSHTTTDGTPRRIPARATEGTPRRTHADGRPSPAKSSQAPASAQTTDGTPQRTSGQATEGTPRRTPGQTTGDAPRPPQTRPAEPLRTDGLAQAAEGTPRRPVTPTGQTPPAEGAAPPPSPADTTMPLRPVAPDATTVLPVSPAPPDTTVLPVSPAAPDTTVLPVTPAASGPSGPSVSPAPPDTTVLPASPASSATTPLPTPLAPAPTEPSVTDLRLFDGSGRPDRGRPGSDEAGSRPRRRRRGALLGVAAGACVAVVAAAGYASGLFSYEAPSRDTALPDDLRASVPDAPSSSPASTPPAGSAQATPTAPAAPPPSPSATRSPSASPSPSASSASPSPSQSATPSAPPTSATATGPGNAPPDNSRQNGGPTVLRLGDRGPEVTELQLRLRQLYLYREDPDGDYDSRLEEAVRNYQWSRGIQTDDLGVYDRETRAELESETKKP